MQFVDGTINHTGCRCDDACGLPCWQRMGVAPACEQCGCDPFPEDAPTPIDGMQEAINKVRVERHDDYGPPDRNLRKIGVVWGALLGADPIPPRTVAVMLAGMKVVRAANRKNRDDLIDGIGYLLLADDANAPD